MKMRKNDKIIQYTPSPTNRNVGQKWTENKLQVLTIPVHASV